MKEAKVVKLYNSITNMKDEIIEEAQTAKLRRKNSVWMKWGAVAAFIALTVVFGYGALQRGWFGDRSYIVALDNGDTIHFSKSNGISSGDFKLAYEGMTTRDLTEKEIDTLFHNLPVSAYGYFSETNHQLFGLEGEAGDIKLTVFSLEMNPHYPDAVIDGESESTKVNGVPVTAGYFLTGRNSKGVRTFICYASFELGGNTFYVENAGPEKESKAIRNELAGTIQKLIRNGEADLSQIRE